MNSQAYKSALTWAEKNTPDLPASFAASAVMTFQLLQNRWPTPQEVRDRLKQQGRDR